MNIVNNVCVALMVGIFLIGCSKEPPVDSKGRSPQQVLMETYSLILEGKHAEAKNNFSQKFIEEMITNNNSTFEEYIKNTDGWENEWLKTKVIGNDYNKNVWRVKIIPDEGKGEHNRPGIVHDLYVVDGVWKIVFWGHYQKS